MQEIFFLSLLETQAAHWNVSRQGFAELGLSEGLPKVLFVLRGNEGCVQKKLAVICQVRESTLTVLLKRLENIGYVQKKTVQVSGGKRAFGIYLTDAGKDKADEVISLMERIDSQSLLGFSGEERIQLLAMLDRVRKNLGKD